MTKTEKQETEAFTWASIADIDVIEDIHDIIQDNTTVPSTLLPSKRLDWRTYLLFNKDLIPYIRNETEALRHFEKHGFSEGRLATIHEFYDKFPFFNPELYRKSHIDLAVLNREDLMSHYWYNGQHEKRVAFSPSDVTRSIPYFDLTFYRDYYADLKTFSDSELFAHYLAHGRAQDRLKNSFELVISKFLKDYDRYVILFSRIEDILGNDSSIVYEELSEPIKDLDADLYTDLTTELARYSLQKTSNLVTSATGNKVAVFVIDFYSNLRTDEYHKSYKIANGVGTVFSINSGHFYIRSENLGVIDKLGNPSFIFVRGNNVPMIHKLGAIYRNSTKIFYPATSLTYKKNKSEKNIVQVANYQLYQAAAIMDRAEVAIPMNDQTEVEDLKGAEKTSEKYLGYDIILIDDRYIYDYMCKFKIAGKSKLVLFTKYAVRKEEPRNAETIVDHYDLLYSSYTKGPTKNFNIFMQFVAYLTAKKSNLSILVLNKDDNDDLEELRKMNYPHLRIIITSNPDLYYEYCHHHLLTSGRDAQPRTITETISKGVHNIVLDTLTNGIHIFRDTKIFGTILPTNKTYKGKHYIPIADKTLFDRLELTAKTRRNHQRIGRLAYQVLSREKLLLELLGPVYDHAQKKFVVTFATIDYSNMLSLLLNSIVKTNPDVITIVFCLNWERVYHQKFMKYYEKSSILFVPYLVQIKSKNDILRTKVRLIQECYYKLDQDFIWIDADSIVLSSLKPLYDLFEQKKKQILVFQRPESKNEYEKVALGVVGFSKFRPSYPVESRDVVGRFINIWMRKVESCLESPLRDWFADQISFYRTMNECLASSTAASGTSGTSGATGIAPLSIHSLTNAEHSINGYEDTIIYSRRRNNKRSIGDLARERGIDSEMLIIPGLKYAYIDQTVDHYSLFFVTYDYPSNGGAATNLYAIYKLYREMGVTACIAFITEQPVPTFLLDEFKKDPNVFFFTPNKINFEKPKAILQQKKFKVLIFKIYKTLSVLEQNGLSLNLFKKIIYLCSGLSTYEPLSSRSSVAYNQKRIEELYPIEKSHKVIFNSELTESLYLRMVSESSMARVHRDAGIDRKMHTEAIRAMLRGTPTGSEENNLKKKKTIVLNTTLLGMNRDDFKFNDGIEKWKERSIDLIFIVSDCYRKVKNADLVYHLFRRSEFRDLKKVIIGLNADVCLNSVANTTVVNVNKSREEVIKYLQDSKILLLPSFFDSSPNILYEALLSKCNVIAAKNIGNVQILPPDNIIQLTCNSEVDAAIFAQVIPINLKEYRCKEPSLNDEPKKILDDLILLD